MQILKRKLADVIENLRVYNRNYTSRGSRIPRCKLKRIVVYLS